MAAAVGPRRQRRQPQRVPLLARLLLHWAVAACVAARRVGAQDAEQLADWAALKQDIASGAALDFGNLGSPGQLLLAGRTFPVHLNTAGDAPVMVAGRIADGGGRLVAWNKEGYMERNTDTARMNTAVGTLLVNAVRWAGGGAASGIRVAGPPGGSYVTMTGMSNLKRVAALRKITFVNPTGSTGLTKPNEVAPSALIVNGKRVADVYMATANWGFSDTDIAYIQAFIRAGGGYVIGGQAWYHSYSNPLSTFPANKVLAPFNILQYGANGVSAANVYSMPSAMPTPLYKYNPDVAGDMLAKHFAGTTVLTTAVFEDVTRVMAANIRGMPQLEAPAGSASVLTWRSFSGPVASAALAAAAQWNCNSIDSTKGINILAVAYIAKANSELPPERVFAAPCAATFPGLGATIAADPTPIVVRVRASYPDQTQLQPFRRGSNWVSTGVYAAPGAPVTVTLPPSVVQPASGSVIGVQIGSHTDDISGKATWCRLPYGGVKTVWFTAASGNTLKVASTQGGLVYVIVKRLTVFGDIDVTVAGGVKAPFYFQGRTTNADWVASIRNSPSPWAEIGTNRLVVTVPSTAVRTIDDAQKIVDMYDKIMDGYADLAVYPRDRPNNERLVLDCDISAGWLHSGYPTMGYLSQAPDHLSANLGDGSEIRKWGMLHEIGHNHQIGAETPVNTGEVTNNLFCIYIMETYLGVNRSQRDSNRKTNALNYFASGTYPASYSPDIGLTMYLQLQEGISLTNISAGWDFFKKLNLLYQSLDGQVADPQQQWVIETSKAANMNLLPYFDQWKWPVTAATRTAVQALNLPPIAFNPADPCSIVGSGDPRLGGSTCYQCCSGFYNKLRGVASASPSPSPSPAPLLPPDQQRAADWAALTAGLPAGTALPFGPMGSPGAVQLYGGAFPVITNAKGQLVMAAGRCNVSGRVVAFNKEGYMEKNTDNAVMDSGAGRLLLNAVQWVGGGGTTLRVGGPPGGSYVTPTGIANLKRIAAPLGITITYADWCGEQSRPYELTPSQLIVNGARTADVYMLTANTGLSAADQGLIRDFINAGGGYLIGGQAWYFSYSNPVAQFPANLVLAPLRVLQYTSGGSDYQANYTVPAAMPGPLYKYNADQPNVVARR